MNTKFDSRPFREALGSFTTGVTIVTTRDADGHDVGLTANSFNSVSLDPPMVLWSLARSSLSLATFKAADYFAVHVLAADQQELSNLFATRGADKFAGIELDRGHGDIPLLPGCSARFECSTAFQYEGGDHEIFVGEVVEFEDYKRPPLVFQSGKYAVAVQKPPGDSVTVEPQHVRPNGSFGKNELGFLLGVAAHQLRYRLNPKLDELGINRDDYAFLVTLLVRDGRSREEMTGLMSYMGRVVPEDIYARLMKRGLIMHTGGDPASGSVSLTPEGREAMIEIVAATKAIEADAESVLDYGEQQLLKQLLRRIIRATDLGEYKMWSAQGTEEN